jgi:hypothetical protein
MHRQTHCIAPGNEPCNRRYGLGANQVGSESLCRTDFSGFRRKVFRMALDRAFSSEDEHVRKLLHMARMGFSISMGRPLSPPLYGAQTARKQRHECSGTLTSREAGSTVVVLLLGLMPPCPPSR